MTGDGTGAGVIRPFEFREPIETSRLRLRPFAAGDFDALFSYQSRDDVTRYLLWGARSRDEVRHGLELKIAATAIRSEGDFLAVAAESVQTGEIVGDIVLGFESEEASAGRDRLHRAPRSSGSRLCDRDDSGRCCASRSTTSACTV